MKGIAQSHRVSRWRRAPAKQAAPAPKLKRPRLQDYVNAALAWESPRRGRLASLAYHSALLRYSLGQLEVAP